MIDLLIFATIVGGAWLVTRMLAGFVYYLELKSWISKNDPKDEDEVYAAVPVSQTILHFSSFVMFVLTYMGLVYWWR
jgi:hypothetical protein